MWIWNGMPNDGRDVAGWLVSRGADHGAAEAGEQVTALDLDPQGSLAGWGALRKNDGRSGSDAVAVDRVQPWEMGQLSEILGILAEQFCSVSLETIRAAHEKCAAAQAPTIRRGPIRRTKTAGLRCRRLPRRSRQRARRTGRRPPPSPRARTDPGNRGS